MEISDGCECRLMAAAWRKIRKMERTEYQVEERKMGLRKIEFGHCDLEDMAQAWRSAFVPDQKHNFTYPVSCRNRR